VVVRIQGRGTFVAERRHSMDAPWHCRFLNDLGDGFLPVYTHVLSRELTHATGPWTKF
jgi:DNA-binding GntR family transcriptional regulator